MSDSNLAVRRTLLPPHWLREAGWLNGERVQAYAGFFVLATVLAAAVRIVMAHSGGTPIRADYVSFWSAGRLALAGHAAAAFDAPQHFAVEQTVFPGFGYEAFFYPPVFLLLCAPAALLAFWPSYLGFISLTLLGYWRTLSRLLPHSGVIFLGFPAVGANLLFGQNGLFTAALFAAALLWLPRRAALAGVCFGCLCYKPHLGLTVPLALLAAGEWRALFAAAGTVIVLVGASVMAFGIAAWRGFLDAAAVARHTLEVGLVDNAAWESVFRAVVQTGAGVRTAYAVQAVITLGAVAAMVRVCWRRAESITGVLPMAALLSTPFLLDYDLALLAIPMAWVVLQARRGGFLPWEKVILALAYVLPLLSLFAGQMGVPLGPPVMLVLFAVVLRRAWLMPPG